MTRRWLQWLAVAVFILGIVNFLWVWMESATVGDALQGRIENGHYLLVNKGTVTEVSREAWEWSFNHSRSVLVTHPLALVAALYLVLTTWPQFAGVSSSLAAGHTSMIRASGLVNASARIGARIGPVMLTAPLVKVEVHPGGLVLAAWGSPPLGIRTSSIVSVGGGNPKRQADWIRIIHREAGIPSDIRFYLAEDHPVVTAVRELAGHAAAQGEGQPVDVPRPERPEKYPTIVRVGILFGFVVALVLIFEGITVVIPNVGPFGWVWTLGIVLILAINVYRFVIRARDRW